jgi:hypothetical protein
MHAKGLGEPSAPSPKAFGTEEDRLGTFVGTAAFFFEDRICRYQG